MTIWLAALLSSAVLGADTKVRMDTALGYDGGGRWQGYGIVSAGSWSFGAAGQWNPVGEALGMPGINSPILTLGHLSDAGLAAEARNPECSALSRAAERTVYRADLRSFSASRMGIVLSHWDGRAGVGWERRPGLDTGLMWASLVDRDVWRLEMLWSFGLLAQEVEEDEWYPKKAPRPGGAFTLYALRSRFEFGSWNGALTGLLSGGASFRPGLFLAGSMGLSARAWKLRMRGTWSTEFFRNAEGELPDVPAGIALDGHYSPNRGPIIKWKAHLPIWTYHRLLPGEKETGMAALGWRFDHFEIRSRLEWDGLTGTPAARRIAGELRWSGNHVYFDLDASWDFIEAWSIRLKWEQRINRVWGFDFSVKLHRETSLLADIHAGLSLRYARGRIELNCTALDLPRDWQDGPSSAGDLDIELRWSNKFYD